MAVSPDMLFAVLRSYHDMRSSRGYSTNMRVLRALMEHGPHDESVWLREVFTEFASNEDVFAFMPTARDGSCWINPQGTIFSIRYGGHERFSYLVAGSYNTALLENAGWIHVSDRRIDLEYDPTSAQQRAIDDLQLRMGYKVSDRRRFSRRVLPADVEKIPPALHNLRMISEYKWEDPRWWEGKGIPRSAHRVHPKHEAHVTKWRDFMYDGVYSFDRGYWTAERIRLVAEHSRRFADNYVPYRLELMEQGEI